MERKAPDQSVGRLRLEAETGPTKNIMNNSFQEGRLFRALPTELRIRIGSPPKAGAGVHQWIFKAAGLMREKYNSSQTFRIIRECLSNCERCVPDREIEEAIRKTGNGKVSGNGVFQSATSSDSRWPSRDEVLVSSLIEQAPHALNGFRSMEAAANLAGDYSVNIVIDQLFPGDPLLCFGRAMWSMTTRRKSEWLSLAASQQFIVPSPMTTVMGLNQQGKPSHRCLENTGARRFLVVEFDQNTIEEQASLHLHLSGVRTLALVVYSGSKSLHGWYFVEGEADAAVIQFMRLAVRLGADSATWSRCQAVRAPGGMRENGNRQRIEYFNPHYRGGEV